MIVTNPQMIGTGTIAVHDIFDPLPNFMCEADLVFTDPPWNLSLLNNFSRRAGIATHGKFSTFYHRLFECIGEIRPREAFVEIGRQHVKDFQDEMGRIYPCVMTYGNFYYHKPVNVSHIVHGSSEMRRYPLDGLDEEDAIAWVCQNAAFECIADLCMGRGLVGWYANRFGRRFAGTEANAERLAVLVERINTGKLKKI